MRLQVKGGTIPMKNTKMDYIRFGSGPRNLVMLPGLGDGLQTVKGLAIPMAWMYREFLKDFTVHMFSRPRVIPQGTTTRDMARDIKSAMDALGITKADVFGVSMGGMIAQWLAIDYPQAIEKLVLVVTSSKPNAILIESVREWIDQASRGDHTALMDSNLRRIYSEGYYRKNRWMVPLMGKFTKPKSYTRFLVQAEACLSHNAYDDLQKIQAKTLIIGGEQDHALTGEASYEIAGQLPNGELKMYQQWGHGLYDEEKEFNRIIKEWLLLS